MHVRAHRGGDVVHVVRDVANVPRDRPELPRHPIKHGARSIGHRSNAPQHEQQHDEHGEEEEHHEHDGNGRQRAEPPQVGHRLGRSECVGVRCGGHGEPAGQRFDHGHPSGATREHERSGTLPPTRGAERWVQGRCHGHRAWSRAGAHARDPAGGGAAPADGAGGAWRPSRASASAAAHAATGRAGTPPRPTDRERPRAPPHGSVTHPAPAPAPLHGRPAR